MPTAGQIPPRTCAKAHSSSKLYYAESSGSQRSFIAEYP
jgi:hypothetical protein